MAVNIFSEGQQKTLSFYSLFSLHSHHDQFGKKCIQIGNKLCLRQFRFVGFTHTQMHQYIQTYAI